MYLSAPLADTVAPTLHRPSTSRSAVSPITVEPAVALGLYYWPDDGRPTPLQYALIGSTPPVGKFDQCWVRATSPTVDPSFLLRSTLLDTPAAPGEVEVAQLNPRFGESLTAATDFISRPTRLAWSAAFGLGTLLAAASIWLRRLELATARELGVPLLSQLSGMVLESFAWALTGVALSTPVLLARAAQGEGPERLGLVTVGVPVLLAGLVGSLLGSVATTAVLRRRTVNEYLRTR